MDYVCFYRRVSVHRGGGGVCLSAWWDTTPPGADPPRVDTPHPQRGEGVSASVHDGISPPSWSRHPPRADTPWSRHSPDQTPPRAESPGADPPPKQTHPPPPRGDPPRADTPQEQTPPPPLETATAADGTHPTGMHTCVTYSDPLPGYKLWTETTKLRKLRKFQKSLKEGRFTKRQLYIPSVLIKDKLLRFLRNFNSRDFISIYHQKYAKKR